MTLIMPAYIQRDPDYYVTDFSEYTIGAAPGDWTSRWNAGSTMAVQSASGSLSGKALRITKVSTANTLFSWDKVPQLPDCEILTRARAIEAAAVPETLLRSVARGSGAAGAENCYQAGVHYHTSAANGWRRNGFRLNAGVSTSILSQSDGPAPAYATNNWYWQRFRVVGTSISQKIWWDGQSEPGTFDQSVTDSSIAGGGWIGLYTNTANPDCECDFFSVALNGKTAAAAKR